MATRTLTLRVRDRAGNLSAPALVDVVTADPTTRTLAGMSYGGNTDPSAFEAQIGKPISVWRLYYQANEVAKAVTAIATAGAKGRKVVWASFKLPASWAVMATGAQDAWVRDMAKRVSAAAVAANVTVCVCLHHEPDGDQPIADYVAMQRHCLPLVQNEQPNMLGRLTRTVLSKVRLMSASPPAVRRPNLLTSIIFVGYMQTYGGAWSLDACWPGDGLVDVIGVDPYLMYGTWQDYNKTPPQVTTWMPPDATLRKFSDFAKAHGCDWAVAETGQTNEGYNTPPAGKDGRGFLAQQLALATQLGAKWWCYFASTYNSRGSWEIDSAEATAKRAALAAVLATA